MARQFQIHFIFSFIFVVLTQYLVLNASANSANEDIPKNLLQIQISQNANTIEKNQHLLFLHFKNAEGWHTYWKNPGDAGLPIKIKIFLGKVGTTGGLPDLPLEELEWPFPKKYIEAGDQIGYGYSGDYTLVYRIPQSTLAKLQGKEFYLHATWLICKHVCVPGEIKIPGVSSRSPNSNLTFNGHEKNLHDVQALTTIYRQLPKVESIPKNFSFQLVQGADVETLELQTTYTFPKTMGKNDLELKSLLNFLNKNLVLPFLNPPFDFLHEKIYTSNINSQGQRQLKSLTPIAWDGAYQDPVIPFPKNRKFNKPYTFKFVLFNPETNSFLLGEKTFNGFEPQPKDSWIEESKDLLFFGKEGSGALENKLPAENTSSKKKSDSLDVKTSGSLFYYILMGLLGGLILNVMPCVLPMISLKLFELIKYRKESRKAIFRHNAFYTLGILSTFLTFAIIIVIFKSFGTSVGWGFQLQSPRFILVMILILYAFSLNLFGLYEFQTPGGKYLGKFFQSTHLNSPYLGDFFSGVLATILSTPCSAPFLGTALAFAFTENIYTITIVFLSIGLGLAAPFILTGFFPSIIHLFPKPGAWMITFKKLMGLSLLLTLIWLFDLFLALTDFAPVYRELLLVIIGMTLIFLFRESIILRRGIFVSTIILGIFLFQKLSLFEIPTASIVTPSTSNATATLWKPWSPGLIDELKNQKAVAFIDFTAKWCFTCKINEKVVLDSPEFLKLAKDFQINLVMADWTKRDETITTFLKGQGLVGVPAYFLLKSDGQLLFLGETISVKKIKAHL